MLPYIVILLMHVPEGVIMSQVTVTPGVRMLEMVAGVSCLTFHMEAYGDVLHACAQASSNPFLMNEQQDCSH